MGGVRGEDGAAEGGSRGPVASFEVGFGAMVGVTTAREVLTGV